jgi:uncharacterized protein with HEPN domain
MMKAKSPKWLEDIVNSIQFIQETTSGVSREEFEGDLRVRYAIERCLITIGEALLRLERTDPETAVRIGDYRLAIGMRNRLTHEIRLY